jgi:hypothetical protein
VRGQHIEDLGIPRHDVPIPTAGLVQLGSAITDVEDHLRSRERTLVTAHT